MKKRVATLKEARVACKKNYTFMLASFVIESENTAFAMSVKRLIDFPPDFLAILGRLKIH